MTIQLTVENVCNFVGVWGCVCIYVGGCVCVCVVHDILEKAVEVHSTFKAYSGTTDLIYIYTYMYICVYVQEEVYSTFKAN